LGLERHKTITNLIIEEINNSINKNFNMDISIFQDKSKQPNVADLKNVLDKTFDLWITLRDYVFEKYPSAIEVWNYSGEKYGWSFRIKDKKRAIIYLLPRDRYFKVAMVFGEKATQQILISKISDEIKSELKNVKVYAEGRGIRLDVKDKSILKDIKVLIDIKLSY